MKKLTLQKREELAKHVNAMREITREMAYTSEAGVDCRKDYMFATLNSIELQIDKLEDKDFNHV